MQDMATPHPAERTHSPLSRRATFVTLAIVLVVLVLAARFTYDYPRYLLPTFLSAEDAAVLAGEPVTSGGGLSGYGTSDVWLLESGGRLAALSFYAEDTPPGVPMVSVGPDGAGLGAHMDETGDIRGFESGEDDPIIDVTVSCLRVQVLGVPRQRVEKAAVGEVEASLRESIRSYVDDGTLKPCVRALRRR